MSLFDMFKSQASSLIKNAANSAARSAANAAVHGAESAAKAAASAAGKKTFSLSALPAGAEELKALPEYDLSDPYFTAAATVAALNRYPEDREAAKAMLNVLKGPQPLSNREIQFINDRFMDGKAYVTRSYFGGTSPENDYTLPAPPYTVSITEYSNSRDNEGYIKLFLNSSGADSPRQVTLRHKPSTNEWFLWEFEALLQGIRIPKSTDKWA